MDGNILAAPAAFGRAAQHRFRSIERELARHAATRAMVAGPRTAKVLGETAIRRVRGGEGPPIPRISPGFVAQVLMDETILALAMGPNMLPRRADYERVGAELAHARILFETRGWLDSPASYHRTPPPLADPAIGKGWALGQSYESVLFPSEFQPRDEEPGTARWRSYEANRTASATVLRYRDRPRPWVVAIHGFGTGYPFMDFIGMHARRIHQELGVNVVLPVLPLHGPRKLSRISGEAFLSFDLMNSVHGLTQAVWDIRRIISWVRSQEATSVSLYGVSLGAYTSALVGGIEPGLDTVVAGIPVVDFPDLIRSHSPHNIRMRAIDHSILGGNAEDVHRVVSPLSFPPLVPIDHRFIFGGLGDRLALATQAHRLWKHWDEPEILWYGGNHVGYLWASSVPQFVLASLPHDSF